MLNYSIKGILMKSFGVYVLYSVSLLYFDIFNQHALRQTSVYSANTSCLPSEY